MDSFHLLKNARDWIKEILVEESKGSLYIQREENLFYIVRRLPEVTLEVALTLLRQKGGESIICGVSDEYVTFSDIRFNSAGGSFASIPREDFLSTCNKSCFFERKLKFERVNGDKKPLFLMEGPSYLRTVFFPSFEGENLFRCIDSFKRKLKSFGKEIKMNDEIKIFIPAEVIPEIKPHSLSRA